jgi:hypothetical protein
MPSDISAPMSARSVSRLALEATSVRGTTPGVWSGQCQCCGCFEAEFEAAPLGNGPCCACICPCFETE